MIPGTTSQHTLAADTDTDFVDELVHGGDKL